MCKSHDLAMQVVSCIDSRLFSTESRVGSREQRGSHECGRGRRKIIVRAPLSTVVSANHITNREHTTGGFSRDKKEASQICDFARNRSVAPMQANAEKVQRRTGEAGANEKNAAEACTLCVSSSQLAGLPASEPYWI